MSTSRSAAIENHIAVVGMAGRYPGAKNIQEFWANLRDGVESVTVFSDEELAAQGISRALLDDPNYVRARAVLDGIELFDAGFFGVNPREAEIMDPQHRVFLECAWEALEDSGYNPDAYDGAIGVFASTLMSSYLISNLLSNRELLASIGPLAIRIANDRDFLPMRVSYKLNLRGPSFSVETACSSSLVATHLACQALLDYQCDMALVGGVSISIPQKMGHFYQEGSIYSPDGHCRAFDKDARGTVSGSGMGIVVLKRLEDALQDGDTVHAVILGSAINNDGSQKVGYTAPSVQGQAEAIVVAQTVAKVDPATISYIEAHGTGTQMGDPVEIAALNQVFRESTDETQFCAIGSVKTNIGHLDTAAGVTGLIKTVLALKHQQLPPSLHFNSPNPELDLDNSPFYVNSKLSPWVTDDQPRRAGVSSFAVGGTNAHVVLEEAPTPEPTGPSRPAQLLVLSAKSEAALAQASQNLATHLQQQPTQPLADVAYTLQVGRKAHEQRRMLVCRDAADAISALESGDPQRVLSGVAPETVRPVVFMFPGQGAQYIGMGRELYETEPTFRAAFDQCARLLKPQINVDLRAVIYPPADQAEAAQRTLTQTNVTQPALFAVEYALAQLWIEWGIQPAAMIGHSIGEYVAATLAEVLTLEEALRLVAVRGRLMQALPGGGMLTISLPADEVAALLHPEGARQLSIAAINGPALCVVAGPLAAVDALQARLQSDGVDCRRLHTSHAFHSAMMDPMLKAFEAQVRMIKLREPKIPYISNVTGTWISAADATDPAYWVKQIRQTVRFSEGIATLLSNPARVMLEVGPGRTLSTFVRQHGSQSTATGVVTSLRHPQEQASDCAFILQSLGKLWLQGVRVDWAGFATHEQRGRVSLPTYPFERKRYWIEPLTDAADARTPLSVQGRTADPSRWFYTPVWRETVRPRPVKQADVQARSDCWLLFSDESWLAQPLARRLRQLGRAVVIVRAGETFARVADDEYTIDPARVEDYRALLATVAADRAPLSQIVYLQDSYAVQHSDSQQPDLRQLLLFHALGQQQLPDGTQLTIVTHQAHQSASTQEIQSAHAISLGLARVLPRELPHMSCRTIDISQAEPGLILAQKLVELLIAELAAPTTDTEIAYRDQQRWVLSFESVSTEQDAAALQREGTYLLVGALDDTLGELADTLVNLAQANVTMLIPRDVAAASIQALTARGVQIERIDLADRQQLQAVLADLALRSGHIDGVIVSASTAVSTSGHPPTTFDPATTAQTIHQAIEELQSLTAALADQPISLVVLYAPLAALLGRPGGVAEAGVSAFIDALVRSQNRTSAATWKSVLWDEWRFVSSQPTLDDEFALTSAEGVAVFQRSLALEQASQIVISTGDLQRRRAALRTTPEPVASVEHTRPKLATAYVAPTDPAEQALVALWQTQIGIDQVGIYDNFFELGGHSLLATRLLAQVREHLGVEITLQSFFDNATVAGMAVHLRRAAEQPATPQTPPILPTARNGALPLSFAQERLWALDQIEPGSARHTLPLVARLEGALDLAALERSLNAVVRRHETLRTTFRLAATGDEQPIQVIAAELVLPLPLTDLCAWPRAERAAVAARHAAEEVAQPFNLKDGPLLRARVLQLDEQEHLLLLTVHHIIMDAWSMSLLVNEIAAHYAAMISGPAATEGQLITSAPTIQYADFAVWQRTWLVPGVPMLEQQLGYWREQLAELPVLELPTDRPRPLTPAYRGATCTLQLTPEIPQALAALSQREGVTPFIALLTAFKLLLARYSGQDDIVVGVPSANRTRSETEQIIGLLANIMVLRTDLGGNPTVRELLGRVRQTTMTGYAHQDVSFEQIVEALRPPRRIGYHPVFQVMFNFLNMAEQAIELPGLRLIPESTDRGSTDFDLFLTLSESAAGLKIVAEYNADLFQPSTIERMMGHFQLVLEALATDPEQPASALLAQIPNPKLPIAVAATFTAEPLNDALAFCLQQVGLSSRIDFAPYNQVFQQLLDPTSQLSTNRDGVNVILLRLEDWAQTGGERLSTLSAQQRIEQNIEDFLRALTTAVNRAPASYLIGLCPPTASSDERIVDEALFTRMAQRITAATEQLSGVYTLDLATALTRYQVTTYCDPVADMLGHIPFTEEFFAVLGATIARHIFGLRHSAYKVIGVDCDNTLWGGVCGEDGPAGVRLDQGFLALQHFLVQQHAAGMLLCICSKNNETDVIEVFQQRLEMPLRLEHFVTNRINWLPKSENLTSIAQELQLSLDSFIFLDDSALECAEVRSRSPEVLSLTLPAAPAEMLSVLEHTWAFDHLKVTSEDRRRSLLYQQNKQREQLRSSAASLDNFLAGLELTVTLAPMQPAQLTRTAELTFRTNQFNATTIRRTESELRQLIDSGQLACWVAEVRDRFGDYGLVGVLAFAVEGQTLRVDTFLLSCRVLGRRVEDTLLLKLAEIARERGCTQLVLDYRPTPKNAPFLAFLQRIEPQLQRDGSHELRLSLDVDALLAGGLARLSASPTGDAPSPAESATSAVTAGSSQAAQVRAELLTSVAMQLQTSAQILAAMQRHHTRSAQQREQDFVAPRTEAETMLAQVWADVLRLERVGVLDDFFALGGDSIHAVQIVARCSRAGYELSAKQIFEHQTVAALAAVIGVAETQAALPDEDVPAEFSDVDLSDESLASILSQISGS